MPLKPKEIIEKFGYVNGNGRKALKITLTATAFNPEGFKLELDENTQRLNIVNRDAGTVAYFELAELFEKIKKKLHANLVLVLADCKKTKKEEYFLYKKAIILKGLNIDALKSALRKGLLVWEFRMHINDNGAVRDHGPAFRISQNRISELYGKQEVLFDAANSS